MAYLFLFDDNVLRVNDKDRNAIQIISPFACFVDVAVVLILIDI